MVENAFISSLDSLHKGQLPVWNVDEWTKIKEEYPCFAGAFILEAIHAKSSDEKQFEALLPAIALRVPNRAVLYDRVHEDYKTKIVQAKAKETPEEKQKRLVEDKTEEKSEVKEEAKAPLKNLLAEIKEKRKTEPKKLKKKREQRVNVEGEVNKNRKKDQKPVSNAKSKPKPQAKQKVGSFTDWLKNQKSVETNVDQVPIDPAASHEAALYLEAKKSSHQLEDFLVDAIERKQKRKQQKSVPESPFAISETYAKILAQQGKYEEAIHVYKELSIKYPKKSSTFARQIEKLKSN